MNPFLQFALTLLGGGVGAKLLEMGLAHLAVRRKAATHAAIAERDDDRHARDELWKELSNVRVEVKELKILVTQLQNDRLALIAERDKLKLHVERLQVLLNAAESELVDLRGKLGIEKL